MVHAKRRVHKLHGAPKIDSNHQLSGHHVKTSVTTSRRRLRKASVPHTSTSRAASKPAMYSSYLMRDAIGGHQRSLEFIGGHHRQQGVVPGERALNLPRAKRVQRILGVFVPVPVLIPIRNRRLDGESFPAGQAQRRRHARGEHEGGACMQRFVPDEGGTRRSSEVIGGHQCACMQRLVHVTAFGRVATWLDGEPRRREQSRRVLGVVLGAHVVA